MKNYTRFIASLIGICLLAFSFSSCEKENITASADAPNLRTLDEIVERRPAKKSPKNNWQLKCQSSTTE